MPLFRKPLKLSENTVNTSLLEQELAPLNMQIEHVLKMRETFEDELRVVEAELETFSADRQRFEALRDVCNALDRLGELEADGLFWNGIPGGENSNGHLEKLRSQINNFEEQISGVLERQASLQDQIGQQSDELDYLYEEVQVAYDREERRQEEFVIEREISTVPYRAMIMPWTKEAESERRFRRAIFLALLISFVFGIVIPIVNVPIPEPSVTMVKIPERLAKLVKKEPPKPLPRPKPKQQQKEEIEQKKSDKSSKSPKPEPKNTKVADSGGGKAKAARKKAERVGVLAFKEAFASLMDETPIAKLGTEARLRKESPRVSGQAVAQRSLVTIQAQGNSSVGLANVGVSRNLGNGNADRLGGTGIGKGGGSGNGFARVESSINDLAESERPLSDGPAPGRTDEEIQIVFDRYKATLYRIYNRELRNDPTLRGKILLRISIETSGAVSLCKVESTDLTSPELVSKIVERVRRFNFGPKEGVPTITILYPIDFLPAG